jgi:cytochrome P450
VALKMGPVKVWVLSDAEAARALLVTDGSSWTRPPATLVPIRVGVGENLFTQSDKAWAKTQPFVAPAFRRKAIEPRLASIPALIGDDIGSIPLDTDVDLERVLARIALRLAAWVLLGEELEPERADELARHQRAVVGWVGTRLASSPASCRSRPARRGARCRATAPRSTRTPTAWSPGREPGRVATTTCSEHCCRPDQEDGR